MAVRLAIRRSFAQAPALLAIAGVVLLTSALLTGIPAFLEQSATASLRGTLDTGSGTAGMVRVQVRLAGDAGAQDAGVREVLSVLPAHAVDVQRSVRTDPLEFTGADEVHQLSLGADPLAIDRSEVLAGTWPAAAGELAVTEDSGLDPGDQVAFGDDTLVITALYRPLDARDPAWAGETGTAYTTEATIAALDVNPFARWTVLPVTGAEGIRPDDLPALAAGFPLIDPRMREAGLAPSGVIVDGGLPAVLDTLNRSVAAVRGVTPIPFVLAVVIGGVAVLQLSQLLAGSRGAESVLLRSRGRSPRQAIRSAIAESAAVAVPAAALGAFAGSVLGGGAPHWPLVAAGVAAGSITAVTVPAVRGSDSVAGRGATAVTLGVLVLLLTAAGVAIWQLRLYGSPVITTADGTQVVDPLAALAPALGLLAAAFVALALFGPLSALAERLLSMGDGPVAPLAARQVARRITTFGVPVLLVSLAVGGSVLSATYAGTWTSMNDRAGALRNGTDVRVRSASPAPVGDAGRILDPAALGVPESTIAPVQLGELLAGDQPASLVAVAGDAVSAVMLDLQGGVDVDRLGTAMDSPDGGLALPGATIELTAQSTIEVAPGQQLTPRQGAFALSAWVIDARGLLAELPLTDEGLAWTGTLPTGFGDWHLLAVDLTIRDGFAAGEQRIAVTAVTSGGTAVELPAEGWLTQPAGGPGTTDASGIGVTIELSQGSPQQFVRLMPPDSGPAPAVVTEALASRLDLAADSPLQVRFAGSGRELDLVVAGTTALLPGSVGDWGVLADLRAVVEQSLRGSSAFSLPGDIWIATDEPEELAARLSDDLPEGTQVTTVLSGTGSELLTPVTLALALGAAGGLLLALVAVAAASATLDRRRRPEIPVLKAAGLAPGQQAGMRAAELAGVLGFAIAAGAGGGMLISALTVGDLARSAVLDAPAQLATLLSVDPVQLLIAGGAFGAMCAALIAVSAARVRAMAVAATGRELET